MIVSDMVVTIQVPSRSIVGVCPLSQQEFAAFGTVIENPTPGIELSTEVESLPQNAIPANQGTAIKYQDVSKMLDLYGSAPSMIASRAVMNMFVCSPRMLNPKPSNDGLGCTFHVKILERHPFTTQTFIPLGLSPAEDALARYLVIVAPSLSPSTDVFLLPVPLPTAISGDLPGQGLPDVANLRAFMAKGCQAVTYGPGTWHAPMVVIGTEPVSFVVVQFANGVDIEDCQEVVLHSHGTGGIHVLVCQ